MGLLLRQVSGVARLIGAGASNHNDRTLTEIMKFKTSYYHLLNLLLYC
jgi:hypothetical protein